jgi:hypothetical protein
MENTNTPLSGDVDRAIKRLWRFVEIARTRLTAERIDLITFHVVAYLDAETGERRYVEMFEQDVRDRK